MKYNLAFKLANRLRKKFLKKGMKIFKVGSLLRKEPIIENMLFITQEQLPNFAKYYSFGFHGIKVGIWRVKRIFFGRFLFGYPEYLIIAIRKALRKKGFKLGMNEITNLKTNKEVKIIRARQIFKLADIRYRPILPHNAIRIEE